MAYMNHSSGAPSGSPVLSSLGSSESWGNGHTGVIIYRLGFPEDTKASSIGVNSKI